jgi:hypothetical protein
MKKIIVGFLFVLLIILAGIHPALAMEPETIEIANKVIRNIFDDIKKAGNAYTDLRDFYSENLTVNEFGVSQIVYKQKSGLRDGGNIPLELGVTVVPLDEFWVEAEDHPSREWAYSLLDCKIVAYQTDTERVRQYSLIDAIKVHGYWLEEHQQTMMPLRLSMVLDREAFSVNEKVGITVRLKNDSNANLSVRKISEETFYLNVDGIEWGSPAASVIDDSRPGRVVLRPGQTIEKHFFVGPFLRPGSVEGYGLYHISFQGVKPFVRSTIRIVSSPSS